MMSFMSKWWWSSWVTIDFLPRVGAYSFVTLNLYLNSIVFDMFSHFCCMGKRRIAVDPLLILFLYHLILFLFFFSCLFHAKSHTHTHTFTPDYFFFTHKKKRYIQEAFNIVSGLSWYLFVKHLFLIILILMFQINNLWHTLNFSFLPFFSAFFTPNALCI